MTKHLNDDYRRKHRAQTRKAMKAMVRHCPSCERGQYPARFEIGDGRRGYVCRYCKHEWSSAQGIEAQRATTAKQGVVYESPVAESDAPNPQHPNTGTTHKERDDG